MSSRVRLLLSAIGIVVLVGALLVLRPGGETEKPSAGTVAEGATAGTTSPTGSTADVKAKPKPKFTRIVVRDAQPVGGVKTLVADKGEKLRFVVTSDVEDEVHVHGFDVSKPVGPGKKAKFVIPASMDGIYEVELEVRAVPIAEIRVDP